MVTPPDTAVSAAAIRTWHVPAPGSQNPDPEEDVPVSVTGTDAEPAFTEVGDVDEGVAGGGAMTFPISTPQLFVASTYSWIVQNVWPSQGSTLVWE